MGGAVGMAARRVAAATRVTGVADRPETIQIAKSMGAVDEATMDLREGVRDADLVILAVPVSMIPEVAAAVIPSCHEGTILTDLGSSKLAVVGAVEQILQKSKAAVHFVGSHPIAGSEKNGIECANAVNLNGAACVLTPTPSTDHEAYRRVDDFWKALGMKTMRLSPDEHDAVLARSSHLPHLLSYALMNLQNNRSLSLSGTGLRDMARLSGSDVALWTDILVQNNHEVSKVLREYILELQEIAEEIEQLAQPGTPAAEAARERLFRFLADAKESHREHYSAEEKDEPADAMTDETLRSRDTQIIS